MYDRALNLNPLYAETYITKGNNFIFIFQELH